jgi:antitoxin (DNA-binding transcriptional repressor) of toxin-antitoxin stability system
MKTYSIMATQHNLSKVLREVSAGYEVGITRRKELVAKLVPANDDSMDRFPDFSVRAQRLWGGSWQGSTTDELVDATRGER